MAKIIIVEDDTILAQKLDEILRTNGYDTMVLEDFGDLPGQIGTSRGDLVLLDINLPDTNGEKVLKDLRKTSDIPVIMLTSRTSESDEIISMSYGADDFITKPYNPQILLLRIEAVLGRHQTSDRIIKYQNLEIFPLKSEIKHGSKQTILTKNELTIITFLIKNAGQIVSRADVMDHLWSDDKFVDDNTLTVNINRLRKKLADLGVGDLIQTRRSQGYILE